MKDLWNGYNLNNPDGESSSNSNENGSFYRNDRKNSYEESSLSGQDELVNVEDLAPSGSSKGSSGGSTLATDKSHTAKAVATMTTSIGGTVGAISGMVAATLVTAVLMVGTYLGVVGVNVSLIMAGIHELVFSIEAQVEDDAQETLFLATLDGNGAHYEQTVAPNEIFGFYDLNENSEYVLTIADAEGNVYMTGTFNTTVVEQPARGSVTLTRNGEEATLSVRDVSPGKGRFYTIRVNDDKGKSVFATDDVAVDKDFSFAADSKTRLTYTLDVNGEVWLFGQSEGVSAVTIYDYAALTWKWNGESATAIVPAVGGGDPLILTATVTTSTVLKPTCTETGTQLFRAEVSDGENTYYDERYETLSAVGHNYGEPTFEWTPIYADNTDASTAELDAGEETGSGSVIVGYSAVAVFVCSNDPEHLLRKDAEVTTESLIKPTCTETGKQSLKATVTYGEDTYYDERSETLPATGHSYGEPVFEWTSIYDEDTGMSTESEPVIVGYTAVAVFVCRHDPEHLLRMDAEVTTEILLEPDCTDVGKQSFKAGVSYGENTFHDERVEIMPALGHSFGEPVFEWTPVYDTNTGSSTGGSTGTSTASDIVGYTAVAVFVCQNDPEHMLRMDAEMTTENVPPTCEVKGYTTYNASVIFDEHQYMDSQSGVEVDALGHAELVHHFARSATFTTAGSVEYWSCPRCGGYFLDADATEKADTVEVETLTILDGKTFVAWNSDDALPHEAGNYYLTSDVTLSSIWSPGSGETNICLNGHSITRIGDGRVMDIGENRIFGLYECDDETAHYYVIDPETMAAVVVEYSVYEDSEYVKGAFVGGYITGGVATVGGAIWAGDNSVVNINGGTLIGNRATTSDGGAYYSADEISATINVYGGNLIGNAAPVGSGGAIANLSGAVYVWGGRIAHNAAGYGGAIRVPASELDGMGVFVMNDGAIEYNTALMEEGTGGGAIWLSDGIFVMKGGSIGNNTSTYGGAVYVAEDAIGIMSLLGGTISDNSAEMFGGGIYIESRCRLGLSGDASVFDNANGNLVLPSAGVITIEGELSGTVGVTAFSGGGTFTSGYCDYNLDDPSEHFFSDDPSFSVQLVDNEAYLTE